jgi:recombination protein RecR
MPDPVARARRARAATFAGMKIPSKYLEEAVNQMASLPGIGRKTALRLVLNLLKREPEEVERFAEAFSGMKKNLRKCSICKNISDEEVCEICASRTRNQGLICVVEDVHEVMAIEATGQYTGLYHVLGGVISPMDGIGPGDLTVDSLVKRVETNHPAEVILALGATPEGDTTAFFIHKKLAHTNVALTAIARGIPIGDELRYADEVTLGRSIRNRTPYESVAVMRK